MKLGVLLAPVNDPNDPKWIAEQAIAFEALGYHSLWTAQAMGRGFMMTDPLLTLATAAAVTRTIRLGTAVLQLPLYTPLELAHRIFSLQQLCGPRLILGLGAGSTAADFKISGRSFETRFSDFRSQFKQLKSVLETGQAGDSDLSPWPDLLGGPALYFGSWGNGVEMAARHFDGYRFCPLSPHRGNPHSPRAVSRVWWRKSRRFYAAINPRDRSWGPARATLVIFRGRV